MQNRLVAENVLKTPLKGQTFFAINKKLLGYSLDNSLKIKSFNNQAKQYHIPFSNNQTLKSFQFSFSNPWIYLCTSDGVLEIYAVNEETPTPISKILSLKGVIRATQIREAIVLDCEDCYYRVLPFGLIRSSQQEKIQQISLQKLNSLTKKSATSVVLPYHQNQNIYINQSNQKNQQLITVYSMKKAKYEKTLEIDYIKNVLSIYKDRFVFALTKELKRNFVDIFDVLEQKIVGRLDIDGDLKFFRIRENVLLMIMNHQNTDFYWFCALNPNPDSKSILITHKIIYQRGKGDFYDFCNMKSIEALNFTDKKKQQFLNDLLPEQIDNTTTSIVYVLNRQKQKVEIIKFDHSKLWDSPFSEQKIEKKVESSIVKNKAEQEKQLQRQQHQKNKIKASIQHKAHHGKTLQETQKKFIETIVDIKVKHMMQKFTELQHRILRLQKTIGAIYEKIQLNIKNVNREEIRSSVQSLFEQLTPQFQKYFTELFKQVSGVLDQGVSFYNKKIAAEAEIHKHALNQIVIKTFEETQKLIEISKKEQKISEKTQKTLNDLLEARKKWQQKTEEFQQQNREVTVKGTKVYRQPTDGKVFVRADLSKRDT